VIRKVRSPGTEACPRSFMICILRTTEFLSTCWKSQKRPSATVKTGLLFRHVPAPIGTTYYSAPPAMVAAMRQMLLAANVDEDDIRTEEFSGY